MEKTQTDLKFLSKENNIVSSDEYFSRAGKTLNMVANSLSKSLGYYGSTTIIEDNLLSNTITKDGFTILKAIKFGSDDTLSNTLLRSIKDISQSLVMEVGDGSTSAVVTSEALFRAIVDGNDSVLSKAPKRTVIDNINIIQRDIEKIILDEYTTEINEDNFDKLKSIASVSNNNDDDTGNLLYDIYKQIGKDGFIFMEDRIGAEKDTYEISNGIETSHGLIDTIYSNKANGFESEFIKAKILVIQGRLNQSDIGWLQDMVGTFYMNQGRPLVIVASGYAKEVLDFFKINKYNNDKNPAASYEMGITLFNENHKEELKDLAAFLGAKVLDMDDHTLADEAIKPFVENKMINKLEFFETYLGEAEKVYMNSNYSRFIEGKGSEEEINGRLDLINKHIEYYNSITDKTDTSHDIFKMNKRKGNLTSRIAKLYVSGRSHTEVDSRRFLLDDAIAASKSALNHGYVAGGNLAVCKVIKHHLLKDENLEGNILRKALLDIIFEAFAETYRKVLLNAGFDESRVNDILYKCIDNNLIYNLKTNEFEKDSETTIINSCRTDIGIMKSVFSIIGLITTSNQYIQRVPRPIVEIKE